MKKKESGVSPGRTHTTRSQESGGERGFALLLVFLMAAVVGLYLYTQLPRVAFESEREKEQMLIDRGEQYKRAIQLYVAALKKYPQKIEDLENTNDKRYLRQRYLDPMTGKDEWRLIHVNAAGQLMDSLVQKPPCGALPGNPGSSTGTPGSNTTSGTSSNSSPNSSMGTSNMSSSMTPSTGATGDCTPSGAPTGALATGSTASGTGAGTAGAANGQVGAAPADPNDVNAAVKRRPSDVVGNAYSAPVNVDPNDPSTWAPITLAPATNGQPNGQPPSGAVGFNGGLLGQAPTGAGAMNGQVGQPGQPIQGAGTGSAFPLPGQPGFNPMQNQFKIDANGQLVPVTPAQPGQTAQTNNPNGQTGQPAAGPYVPPPTPGQAVGASPFGAQPTGAANAVNPGTGVAPFNQATSAITSMLTNPNPTANGLGASAGMTQGGIAGVASMYKGPSIKIYATRQKYQEWEFVFSMNNQQGGGTGQPQNPLGGAPLGGTAPGQNGSSPTGPSGPGSPTNPSSGANPSSIFGSN